MIAKESYRKLRKASTIATHQAAARLSPSGGTTFQTTYSPPLSFGESFMKIRSAVPENGCLTFDGRKKSKKNTCKTYTLPPHRRLRKTVAPEFLHSVAFDQMTDIKHDAFNTWWYSVKRTTCIPRIKKPPGHTFAIT